MQAKNGFAVTRSRAALFASCMALVLLASALFSSAASAAKKPPPPPVGYIAIGDSLGFGYTQQKFEENFPKEEPTAFEGGYVNVVANRLKADAKKEGNSLLTFNLSCPGERTTGMIGNGPLGKFLEAEKLFTEGEEPCPYHNKAGFPRHFEYGPASQVEAALGVLKGPVPVHLVTLNMGSNDELKKVAECESEAYREAHGFKSFTECLVAEAPALFEKIIHNDGLAIGVLRKNGYAGPVGILGFYNPNAEVLPGSDSLQKRFNEAFECAALPKTAECTVEPKAKEFVKKPGEEKLGPGVTYANPFSKFNPQNKNEPKAICTLTEMCNEHDKKVNLEKKVGHEVTAEEAAKYPVGDIHPTPAGYKALGRALIKVLGL
jgi:lysophospholipase L1-like esterase